MHLLSDQALHGTSILIMFFELAATSFTLACYTGFAKNTRGLILFIAGALIIIGNVLSSLSCWWPEPREFMIRQDMVSLAFVFIALPYIYSSIRLEFMIKRILEKLTDEER